MKNTLFLTVLLYMAAFRLMATTATVNLDNFYPQDANGIPLNAIFYINIGTLTSQDLYVEVFGNGQPLSPPIKADAYDLTGDGKLDGYLFQGGTGEFPPAVEGGSEVAMQIRVWVGGPTWEQASLCSIVNKWTQKTGSWDKTAQPLPVPPDVPLLIPGYIVIPAENVCPEPSTLALGLLGGVAFFLRRRKQMV